MNLKFTSVIAKRMIQDTKLALGTLLPAHPLARPPTDSSNKSVFVLRALFKISKFIVKIRDSQAHLVLVFCLGLVEICRVDAMMLD